MRVSLLHAVFVGIDHLFDQLTADETGLTAGELAAQKIDNYHGKRPGTRRQRASSALSLCREGLQPSEQKQSGSN